MTGRLHHLTTSQLAEITGCARATVRRRLAKAGLRPHRSDGRAVWYAAPQAIEAILGDDLNPRAEKARLDRARANLVEFQLAERRDQVAPVDEIARSWAEFVATSRKAIQSVPALATARIPGFTPEMERKLGEMLDATLVELDGGRSAGAEPSR